MTVYRMEFSFNNHAESFMLPVLPESIEIKDGGNGKTYTVAGLGEINVIKDPSLKELKFESIFPANDYPFLQSGIDVKEPGWYVQMIETWMAAKRPIRFIFVGGYEINMAASIESFEWKEVAGSNGDIEFKISLKEYVFYAAKKVMVVASMTKSIALTKTTARANEKQVPKTYTLLSGDNLIKVAKKILGDDSRWKEIQKLNGISDAKLKSLQIGMVLKLPS